MFENSIIMFAFLTDYTLAKVSQKEGKLVYQLNIYSRNLVLNLFFGMLPELDGLEVAKEIRKTSHTPVIMLSS